MIKHTPLKKFLSYIIHLVMLCTFVAVFGYFAQELNVWKDPDRINRIFSDLSKASGILITILLLSFAVMSFGKMGVTYKYAGHELKLKTNYLWVYINHTLYCLENAIGAYILEKEERTYDRVLDNLFLPIDASLRGDFELPAHFSCSTITDISGTDVVTVSVRSNISGRLASALSKVGCKFKDYGMSYVIQGDLDNWSTFAGALLALTDSEMSSVFFFGGKRTSPEIAYLLSRRQFVVGGRSLSVEEVEEWARDLLVPCEVALDD